MALSQSSTEAPAADGQDNGPRYARPIIATRLPEYTNQFQENIRQAFLPNNFKTLSTLGSLQPDQQHVHPFKVGFAGKTTFSDFAYTCCPFDLSDEARLMERREHDAKVKLIGGDQPFFAGYNSFKLKHEVEPLDGDNDHLEYVAERYEDPVEERMRAKWLRDSQQNPKVFLPVGGEKALAKPTRAMLGDAMTALYRSIFADWPEVQPNVISTSEDLIIVYFMCERLKNESGVLTYMNNALRRDEAVIQYDLRKVPDAWNVRTDDGHLMFTFRPPWVRARNFVAPKPAQEEPKPAAVKQ